MQHENLVESYDQHSLIVEKGPCGLQFTRTALRAGSIDIWTTTVPSISAFRYATLRLGYPFLFSAAAIPATEKNEMVDTMRPRSP
jgi:hypothetical protein